MPTPHFLGEFEINIAAPAFLADQVVKNLPASQETWIQTLNQEDSLEEGMATHSSILAWITPWTEETEPKPGGLQSMGSQRVGHNWATNTFHLVETNTPAKQYQRLDLSKIVIVNFF